ncbi:hypothetical protein ATCC53582_00451 [Novacetimonas hansenii]|nr:hypothetical protein ATCC53582_00451 [Novacetimonas hansenii]
MFKMLAIMSRPGDATQDMAGDVVGGGCDRTCVMARRIVPAGVQHVVH